MNASTEDNVHMREALHWRGAPPPDAPAAVVCIHGRGQDPASILDIAARLELPSLAYVAPAAAEGTWYPQRFMSPPAENEPYLSWALEAVDHAVALIGGHGIGSERVVLLGFSQGACLLAEYFLTRPRVYGAVVLFTGGYLGPEGRTPQPGLGGVGGTPVLLTVAEGDDWVPVSRVRETASVFAAMGADVCLEVYGDIGHVVDDRAISAARRAIRRSLNLVR